MAEIKVQLGKKIISKTDIKGKILGGNDYFFEISGYSKAESIGKPHSMLRHPDMPKLVFRLLWTKLHHNQSVNAFVLNRCKNGDHYWVYATVTPAKNHHGVVELYHSIRKKPNEDAIKIMSEFYATLNKLEKENGPEASKKYLKDFLDSTGMKFNDCMARLQAQGEVPTL